MIPTKTNVAARQQAKQRERSKIMRVQRRIPREPLRLLPAVYTSWWHLRYSQLARWLTVATITTPAVAVLMSWRMSLLVLPITLTGWVVMHVRALGWRGAVAAAWWNFRLRRRWPRACCNARFDTTLDLPESAYRRGWVWQDHVVDLPRILQVIRYRTRTVVRVDAMRIPIESWRTKVPDIAAELQFGVTPEVRPMGRVIDLVFIHRAGDAEQFKPAQPEKAPKLTAVPVARSKMGGDVKIPILGQHILITGATGSGKSGMVWALLGAIKLHLQSGKVKVIGIDPKIIELGIGKNVFSMFAAPEVESGQWQEPIVNALEYAVKVMQKRQQAMLGNSRLHNPTVKEPLLIVVIEELLSLVATMTDPKLRGRAQAALMHLLTQGRALGVTVIGVSQLSNKGTLPEGIRDLFTVRITGRVTDIDQARMIMSPEAVRAGAAPHQIELDAPGVAYVLIGDREPVRCRFPYWTDSDIAALAGEVSARPLDTVPAPRKPAAKPKIRDRVRELLETEPDTWIDPESLASECEVSVAHARRVIGQESQSRMLAHRSASCTVSEHTGTVNPAQPADADETDNT